VRSLNLNAWQLSYLITPCSQQHNSALRTAAHGRESENGFWYVMEIEENELEKDASGNQAP
jgi:hypothetical protein